MKYREMLTNIDHMSTKVNEGFKFKYISHMAHLTLYVMLHHRIEER